LADVTRWRYGQKAHLESSLEVLKLWDDDQPPQLLSIEELDCDGRYGLRLNFLTAAVPLERWQAQSNRLGRFFGPGLRAELQPQAAGRLRVELLPALSTEPSAEPPIEPLPEPPNQPSAETQPSTEIEVSNQPVAEAQIEPLTESSAEIGGSNQLAAASGAEP
jgi:hypothetical protein